MNGLDGRVRRQILAVLGISWLAPACADDALFVGDGVGTGGSGMTVSDSASSSASATPPSDEGPDCGAPVSVVVCVPPPGSEDASSSMGAGSTDTGDTVGDASSGSDGGSSGGEATGDGGGSSGEGPPAVPISCEGVDIDDISFCVYDRGEVYEQDGQCCRLLEGYVDCCDGRPFIVHDEARTASAVVRRDWCGSERPRVEGLSAAMRAELAAAWQADGLMEHASIASFSRFVLHLVALGAPPELVRQAQQALADEIEHARSCFALASVYAGAPVGPGPLAVDEALAGPVTLVTAAVAAVREGCIGETLAAYQAEVAAAGAREPVTRRMLEGIAADEARHAALAWRFVAWAMEQGGAPVREAVARAFAEHGEALVRREPERPELDGEAWRAHGRLLPREQAEVLARGRAEIVLPCARALLRSPAAAQPAAPAWA